MQRKRKQTPIEPLKLESWLQKRPNTVFYLLMAVYIIFSCLYFNVKPSIAGDDSSYIIRAINFIELGKFPTYQGPIYPLFLSLIITLTGMNLIVLKLTSMALMVGFIYLFYHFFKNKISYVSLFYTIAVLSVSNLFLFFSSQTFSEALFMVLQMLLFFLVFKGVQNKQDKWIPAKRELGILILTSFVCVLLFLTRTIGFGALLTMIIYYVIQKNYKRAIYITLFFSIIISLFFTVRSIGWDVPSKSSEQSSLLLNKNPYDKSEGKEDFNGFIARFKDNSNLYLSKHLMRIVGFRSSTINSVKPVISLAIYLILILGFFRFAKQNKYLLFTGIYIAIMLGITFFSLQKIWDQYRLIVPFIPLMLVVLVESFLYFGKIERFKLINKIIPFVLVLSVVLTFTRGVKTMDIPTLSKNLRGDKLAGYTPDWISYLQMSEYCHTSLSSDQFVACRKPNMARIYGKGKKFHGIYRIPSNNPDELIKYLKDRKVTHIIMGKLRKNPYMFTGQTINTIQRFMGMIVKKYPETFKLVKKFGTQEPAYLFQINYTSSESKNNNQ